MKLIKYSDYFCEVLKNLGYTHCFAVQGGNIMHLINSANNYFKLVPTLHELTAVVASEYFNHINRKNKSFALVTAGPGLTNCITGIAGAFLESRENLIVGGQVKTHDLSNKKIRQIGIQEVKGIEIVKSITKKSVRIIKALNANQIKNIIFKSKEKRKGPVFIEIPIDVQSKKINYSKNYKIKKLNFSKKNNFNSLDVKYLIKLDKLLNSSKRPGILIGSGCSKIDKKKIIIAMKKNRIPFFFSWNAADMVDNKILNNFGRPNIWGQRYSNILIQQCDLLISFGARLGLQQTGFNYKEFLKNGKIVQIDIDKSELDKKNPKKFLKIYGDACEYFEKFILKKNFKKEAWLSFCLNVKKTLPINENYSNYCREKYISPYDFYEMISKKIIKKTNIIPCSSGGPFTCFYQSFIQKNNQNIVSNKSLASMGYGLAGAIGAALSNKLSTILFEGDGGFVQNFQDLGTAKINNLNIKIFIFNDNGYASIRTTQSNYFKGHYVGCDSKSGLYFPDWKKLFNCYKIPCYTIDKNFLNSKKFLSLLNSKKLVAFIIPIDPKQTYYPKISSKIDSKMGMISDPIHKMTPPLDKSVENIVLKYI
jgi:acetolactate synthase-1/2/3 large subunit